MPPAIPPAIRCAVLTSSRWDYVTQNATATPGIQFVTFDGGSLGLPESANPFALPVVDTAQVVLVSQNWYEWLTTQHPDRADAVFASLERLTDAVVGLDTVDEFALGFAPEAFDRFTLVVKAHGIYRDRDLYNYQVGARVPGSRWTEKLTRLPQRYSDEALEKLRLGLPFFVRDIPQVRHHNRLQELTMSGREPTSERSATLVAKAAADRAAHVALAHAPVRRRPLDVHCMGSVTHTQRIAAMTRLAGFSGIQGITHVPANVRGTDLTWELPPGRHNEIVAAAAPFMRAPVGRIRYLTDLVRHKIVVAPSGYGELTYRHGEALRAGAALVCPSLEHVQLRFPFQDGHNVVYCQTDLADLTERVRELLHDDARRQRIAKAGRADIVAWDRNWRALLDGAIAQPLRDALGRQQPPPAP